MKTAIIFVGILVTILALTAQYVPILTPSTLELLDPATYKTPLETLLIESLTWAIPFWVFTALSCAFLLFAIYHTLIPLVKQKRRILLFLFFIISPAFIYAHATVSTLAIQVGIWLFLFSFVREKHWLMYPLSVLISFNSFVDFLIVFAIFIVRFNSKTIYIIGANLLALLASMYVYAKQGFLIEQYVSLHTPILPITLFGAPYGLSLVLAILGIIGAILMYNSKNARRFYFGAFLVVANLFFLEFSLALTLIVSIVSAILFDNLLSTPWTMRWSKYAATSLIIIIVLIAAIFYTQGLMQEGPSKERLLAYNEIPAQSVVLAHPALAHEISYINLVPFVTTDKQLVDYEQRIELAKVLFNTTHIEELLPLLKEQKISYIVVTKDLQEDYWPSDSGMKVALTNSVFELLYTNKDVTVYRVVS
ncbi:MAG: hypothetical protein ACI8Y7_000010 [Candidatus Woesearchaeota archaeon]|jgi:hypothetical protein